MSKEITMCSVKNSLEEEFKVVGLVGQSCKKPFCSTRFQKFKCYNLATHAVKVSEFFSTHSHSSLVQFERKKNSFLSHCPKNCGNFSQFLSEICLDPLGFKRYFHAADFFIQIRSFHSCLVKKSKEIDHKRLLFQHQKKDC